MCAFNGTRGIIITPELDVAVSQIIIALNSVNLDVMSKAALEWSQQYTLDRLERDIEKVLLNNYTYKKMHSSTA